MQHNIIQAYTMNKYVREIEQMKKALNQCNKEKEMIVKDLNEHKQVVELRQYTTAQTQTFNDFE
jgi:hypothetical protein